MGNLFAMFLVSASLSSGATDSRTMDHSMFTAVLRDHVKNGAVDYAAIKLDARFSHYVELLKGTNPSALAGDKERLAFWINAYNAFTIKVVCDHYPLESIKDLSTGILGSEYLTRTSVWDKPYVEIGGESLSLNDIEHGIIRKRFDDARIHFALVCAAKGCPPLRREAYLASRLDEQLDDQARAFLGQTDKNRIDLGSGKLYLSAIFKWYEGDFTRSGTPLSAYVARYLPEPAASYLRNRADGITIEYTSYDWSLND
jgi:hypothetical protein